MIELHGTKISITKEGIQRVRRMYYVDDVSDMASIPSVSEGVNGRVVGQVELEADQAEEGRQFVVTVTYEGRAGGGGGGGGERKTYSWRREDSAEPIVTNPNFEEIRKRYGGYASEPGSKDYKWPELKLKKGTARNPMEGVESFLSVGGEWQETELVDAIPQGLFEGMWEIVDHVPGGLPTPRSRAWLVMPPSVEQRGAVFVVTRAWKLTGEMDEMRMDAARMIYRPSER